MMHNGVTSLVHHNPEAVIGNNIAPDLTSADLSAQLGGVASRGGMNIEFFYNRIRYGDANGALAGKMETRLYVALQPKGDRLTVAIERTTEAEAAKRFPAEWNYFKNYQGAPTSGTPLHELPGISQSMIAMLVLNGIRSIEDLVEIPADVANTIGLDAVTARNIAVQWSARKNGASKTIELADQAGRAEMELAQALARIRDLEKATAIQDATINAPG